jgi:hypothetical protein
MTTETIAKELASVLDVTAKPGETAQELTKRLALKANTATDDEWRGLSEPSQLWVNEALDALEKKQDLPEPEGLAGVLSVVTEAPPTPAKPKAKEKKGTGKAKPEPKGVKAKAKRPNGKTKAAEINRGPKGSFGLDDKIKLLKETNPFREGSKCYAWYEKYEDGMTVTQAINAGVPRHHIRWDRTLGNIHIGK